jgi:ribosomal protein S18 acetylase RimI-like enzyme
MITIEPAQFGDEEKICELEKILYFDESKDKEDLEKHGFLFYKKTPQEYLRFIKSPCELLLAKDEGFIVGFILGYPFKIMKEFEPKLKHIPAKFYDSTDNTIYISRLAVYPEYQKSGVGQQLYEELVKRTKATHKTTLICHGPIKNNASTHFFQVKNGFKNIGEFTNPEIKVGMYEQKG